MSLATSLLQNLIVNEDSYIKRKLLKGQRLTIETSGNSYNHTIFFPTKPVDATITINYDDSKNTYLSENIYGVVGNGQKPVKASIYARQDLEFEAYVTFLSDSQIYSKAILYTDANISRSYSNLTEQIMTVGFAPEGSPMFVSLAYEAETYFTMFGSSKFSMFTSISDNIPHMTLRTGNIRFRAFPYANSVYHKPMVFEIQGKKFGATLIEKKAPAPLPSPTPAPSETPKPRPSEKPTPKPETTPVPPPPTPDTNDKHHDNYDEEGYEYNGNHNYRRKHCDSFQSALSFFLGMGMMLLIVAIVSAVKKCRAQRVNDNEAIPPVVNATQQQPQQQRLVYYFAQPMVSPYDNSAPQQPAAAPQRAQQQQPANSPYPASPVYVIYGNQ